MHSRVINSFPGNLVYGMRTFFIIHKLGFSFGHFEKNLDVKKAPKLTENSQGFSELSDVPKDCLKIAARNGQKRLACFGRLKGFMPVVDTKNST